MSFRSLMNSKMNVRTITFTPDDFGGQTPTTTTKYTDVPCRIQPMSGAEAIRYGGERTEVFLKVFCPATYSIVEENQLVYSGKVYDVTLVRNIDKIGHHLEIEARELKGAL